MAEYIKREDALSYLGQGPYLFRADKDQAMWLISAVPAADVVEVRHGEWIVKKHMYFPENRLLEEMRCSVCEEEAFYNEVEGYVLTNYCPNCGAKMDGKGEGE